jgi:hypothetical protein
MTEIAGVPTALRAEDMEFVPHRADLATHGCGEVIFAYGSDMHERLLDHTERCHYEGA